MTALHSLTRALAAALLFLASFARAQTYQVTDIGLLDGAPTYATAINDDGIVCGYALPDAATAKAWVFDNSTLTALPGLGGSTVWAYGIAGNAWAQLAASADSHPRQDEVPQCARSPSRAR